MVSCRVAFGVLALRVRSALVCELHPRSSFLILQATTTWLCQLRCDCVLARARLWLCVCALVCVCVCACVCLSLAVLFMRVTAALLASALLALSPPLLLASRASLHFLPSIASRPSSSLVFNFGAFHFVSSASFFSTATSTCVRFNLLLLSSFSISPSHPSASHSNDFHTLHRSAAVFFLPSSPLFPRNFKFNDSTSFKFRQVSSMPSSTNAVFPFPSPL